MVIQIIGILFFTHNTAKYVTPTNNNKNTNTMVIVVEYLRAYSFSINSSVPSCHEFLRYFNRISFRNTRL